MNGTPSNEPVSSSVDRISGSGRRRTLSPGRSVPGSTAPLARLTDPTPYIMGQVCRDGKQIRPSSRILSCPTSCCRYAGNGARFASGFGRGVGAVGDRPLAVAVPVLVSMLGQRSRSTI